MIGWWWVLAAAIGLALAGAALGWWRHRRAERIVWVANSAYLSDLPQFRRAVLGHRLWLAVAAAGLAMCLGGAGWLAARPLEVHTHTETLDDSDVMLCLDVSNSMLSTDAQIADQFGRLVGQLDGERVGIALFNETTSTRLPLTDDYDAVIDELAAIRDALSGRYGTDTDTAWGPMADLLAPTMAQLDGASLIGDGLASCAMAFDAAGQDRSRTVLLATDNLPDGQMMFTLDEATEVLKAKKITLDALYAFDPVFYRPQHDPAAARADLQQCAESTGGVFAEVDGSGDVQRYVEAFTQRHSVDPRVRTYTDLWDMPGVAPWLVWLGALLLVAGAWRARV